ncbi:MAG: lycopene cyclase domain-containing protein [Cytophagales bacterium]|nr:lycopene cyclase domain-containing protein [Cytophagales bacterium]
MYATVLGIAVVFPIIFSFEKSIFYFKKWKYLSLGFATISVFFILWDIIFTTNNIWSFNQNYITNIKIFNVPIEEILFFFVVPFCCVFIYENVKFFIKLKYIIVNIYYSIIPFFILILVAFFYKNLYYTYAVFVLAGITYFLLSRTIFWGYVLITYIVHLIPFMIMNGVLTSLPIVIYDNDYNLNIRVLTIPIEDFLYSFVLMGLHIICYEYSQIKNKIWQKR